jgi:hypothetical protein
LTTPQFQSTPVDAHTIRDSINAAGIPQGSEQNLKPRSGRPPVSRRVRPKSSVGRFQAAVCSSLPSLPRTPSVPRVPENANPVGPLEIWNLMKMARRAEFLVTCVMRLCPNVVALPTRPILSILPILLEYVRIPNPSRAHRKPEGDLLP